MVAADVIQTTTNSPVNKQKEDIKLTANRARRKVMSDGSSFLQRVFTADLSLTSEDISNQQLHF